MIISDAADLEELVADLRVKFAPFGFSEKGLQRLARWFLGEDVPDERPRGHLRLVQPDEHPSPPARRSRLRARALRRKVAA